MPPEPFILKGATKLTYMQFPCNFYSALAIVLLTESVNTQIFTCWIEQDLLPKLPEKSVLVMDNAAFHKGEEMIRTITEAGHTLLYLPPYSPDFNPIEKKWAHAKHIRKSTACSIDELFKIHLA